MMRAKTWRSLLDLPHLDALATLISVAALVAAGSGAGAAPTVRIVAAVSGFLGLGLVQWRRALAERIAARLCEEDTRHPQPLLRALEMAEARLKAVEHRTANVHPVTGIPTREHLLNLMTADPSATETVGLVGAIRFVDFDRLAAFDPGAANAALSAFSRRIVQATGPDRVIGQIDRDCFAIWFRSGDPANASAELRSIAYVAKQEIRGEQGVLTPTIEVATTTFSRRDPDLAPLLQRLTAGLQRPLVSASGALTLASPPSREAARERFDLEQDLAQAIAEDQLTMVFQPVVDLAAGRTIGAEALLRWDHPRLGPVSPARFIPIVEATGQSERYGLWVLNAACREARRWQDEGLTGLKVAVNLSAHQLLDPALQARITRTLERHNLHPRTLELELTETAAMADAERTFKLFGELRAAGVSLAIDDFGSGYSSLSYLKNLSFDKLKIDREFVTQVDARRDSRAICKALIELGRGLDLVVLAEGVETASEVEALQDLGCRVFQGYHFSRPLSGEDFRRLMRDPSWRARLGELAPTAQPDRLSA